MEKHFSLIGLDEKLESLARFTGSSGIVLMRGDEVFAFPEDLGRKIAGEGTAAGLSGPNGVVKSVPPSPGVKCSSWSRPPRRMSVR